MARSGNRTHWGMLRSETDTQYTRVAQCGEWKQLYTQLAHDGSETGLRLQQHRDVLCMKRTTTTTKKTNTASVWKAAWQDRTCLVVSTPPAAYPPVRNYRCLRELTDSAGWRQTWLCLCVHRYGQATTATMVRHWSACVSKYKRYICTLIHRTSRNN